MVCVTAPSVRVAVGEELGLAPGAITTGQLVQAQRELVRGAAGRAASGEGWALRGGLSWETRLAAFSSSCWTGACSHLRTPQQSIPRRLPSPPPAPHRASSTCLTSTSPQT